MAGELYGVDVGVRWSDQDAYGHVNHAAVVTLLEEARAALLFDEATRSGVSAFEAGLLVAALEVRYRRPIPWARGGVHVVMWAHELRAASFRVGYRVLLRSGDPGGGDPGGGDPGYDDRSAAVEASTQLVPYDLAAARPRRLTGQERSFVARYVPVAGEPAP